MRFKLMHLAAFVAASTLCAGIGGVAATYWVVQDEVRDLLDDDLEAQAEFLARLLGTGQQALSTLALQSFIRDAFAQDDDELDDPEQAIWINVYDRPTNTHISNMDHDLPMPSGGSGSVTLELNGQEWFGYQHESDNGSIVQLMHRADRYQEVREEVLQGVALPALVVSSLNLGLLLGLAFLSLWPLTKLVAQLEARRPESLAPFAIDTPAREISVLRDALNGFLADIDSVLRRERDFASDVAHELRTPLTTLRLELASDKPDLPALKLEVERLIGLVSQLLTLARLRRTAWHEVSDVVPLHTVVRDVLDSMQADLRSAEILVYSRLAASIVIGDEILLGILVRNLLANVVRHCPAGTVVDIELKESERRVVLTVLDNGPGVEAARLEALNANFSRLDRRRHGSGLGISICRKIADVHHASLTLSNRRDGDGGLAVRSEFPAVGSAPSDGFNQV